MFRLHWLQVGGPTRGMPRRDRASRKPWPALGLIACLALLQSGCQSGPFSNCGSGCGSGLFSPCGFFGRVQSRVFNRNNGSNCCTPGVVTEGPVEYASPATVVTPGATVVPSYGSGAGTSTTPSVVAPVPPETPSELDRVDPLPKSKIVTPPAGGTNSSGALPGNKTSYQTRRQDPGSRLARRPVVLPQTTVSTPEPTSRSAQVALGSTGGADDQDPLDHLPPLDLPGEVTRSSATPPAPPAAARGEKPASATDNKAAVKGESPAPAADDLDLTSASGSGAAATSPGAGTTGINRFVAVDLKLAGGSAPASDGLKWLADKGYRTVLDLRESSEVPSTFIAEVTGLGLRYIALPINVKAIDRAHVDRFNFEVAAGEARPLFFFDSDGTRAGALWYIRRIANDRMDHQIARREAEGLGLTDRGAWTAATNYVSGLGGPHTTANSTTPSQSLFTLPVSAIDQKPVQTGENASEKPAKNASQSSASPAAAAAPTQAAADPATKINQSASTPLVPAAASGSGFAIAWRPFAAMVISGLAVPLAYWSRTVTPNLLSKARASLPGSAHRPKSLPGESGA
jgi:protein tyrosine phosphatase (PTP) superfamily phosphohydrolase (DUF442 family)